MSFENKCSSVTATTLTNNFSKNVFRNFFYLKKRSVSVGYHKFHNAPGNLELYLQAAVSSISLNVCGLRNINIHLIRECRFDKYYRLYLVTLATRVRDSSTSWLIRRRRG